jgi:hypothetical protein
LNGGQNLLSIQIIPIFIFSIGYFYILKVFLKESKTSWNLIQNMIMGLPSMINPFTFSSFTTEKNLFSKTKFASKKFGQLLAYTIASNTIFKDQTVSLVGFSLVLF